MLKKIATTVFILSFLLLNIQAQQKHNFSLGDTCFLLDGKPLQMISGEMHCVRIPKEYWRERMKMAKAMGLNTIGTYVFWNAHEPEPGKFNFKGNNDIAAFVQIAKEEGLWVVMRPSPYVCAEWEFGGYPYWLLKNKELKVRSTDTAFIKMYKRYMQQLAKQLVPHLITNGGNILMVQIENEYGSYGSDKDYLRLNETIFKEVGFDCPLFTCDPANDVGRGSLSGVLPTVNGLAKPLAVKALVNKYNSNKGPYYVAEWYPGWFDDWGKKHNVRDADKDAANLDTALQAGLSINMYMFHGGTTRDFMNGANMNAKNAYSPQISSYDYDAPLDEAGNPTPKFYKFRNVIQKYLPANTVLPNVPTAKKAIQLPAIQFTEFASIHQQKVKPIKAQYPLSFEALNQAYGFVLYAHQLNTVGKGWLVVKDVRSYAAIFLNGKKVGVLDRRLRQDSIWLDVAEPNSVLELWVENTGRLNFGPYLNDNHQGIVKGVVFNNELLQNWEMFSYPFSNTKSIKFQSQPISTDYPTLYKAKFDVDEIADTYLDMRSFGKGFVVLNGHNLGRYFNIGPQQTIYIPAVWLKEKNNELIVFDQLKSGHNQISTLNHPILDMLVKP